MHIYLFIRKGVYVKILVCNYTSSIFCFKKYFLGRKAVRMLLGTALTKIKFTCKTIFEIFVYYRPVCA